MSRSVEATIAAATTTTAPLLSCDRVTVVHGARDARVVALDDVSLEIAASDRTVLTGRSGSGKTTLLHVLGGLVEPTSGTVRWNGAPLTTLDHAARTGIRRRGIAYVFQTPSLLPYFTVIENVRFAARGDGTADPAELLALVGLAGKHGHLPAELSGGEQQRVAIARALAQQPAVLLCDEPTGHLDSDTARRVFDLIDALQRELAFALVVATHDADVMSLFHREVALLDGRIVGADAVA